jgi:hypothetical protein
MPLLEWSLYRTRHKELVHYGTLRGSASLIIETTRLRTGPIRVQLLAPISPTILDQNSCTMKLLLLQVSISSLASEIFTISLFPSCFMSLFCSPLFEWHNRRRRSSWLDYNLLRSRKCNLFKPNQICSCVICIRPKVPSIQL